MLRATLKSIVAHKLRLALTALSVVLGVAFIAGTLILTDTLGHTFDELFGEADAGTSAVVRSSTALDTSQGRAERAPVPESLLADVRQVDGVNAAVGNVDGYAQLVDPSGNIVGTGQAPGLGVAWSGVPELSPLRLTQGRGPTEGGEIAIDSHSAKDHHISVGDRVRVLLKGPPREETVVGVFTFGSSGNLAGATLTAFDTKTAQRVLGEPGTFSSIAVAAEPGVSQQEMVRRLRAAVPAGYETVTGKAVAAENSNAIKDGLKFFNVFLLVFAAIALFVGSFIIFNTFAMLVAQRTRELALLRAVGASRRQVTLSVLGEAIVVGAIGATGGLGLGVLVALGLKAVLSAFGVTLPSGSLQFLPHTVVWSYVVGVGVTAVSALGPARRAATIPPVAALRDDVAMPERSMHRRAVLGVIATAAGSLLMAAGLLTVGSQPAALVGIGALVVFLGVRSLSPFLSRPVVRALGAPLPRLFGTVGRLGRENALRNPRRTAATAAALMIGLAMLSAMTVFASSVKSSVNHVIDVSVGADFIVTSKSFQGFSTDVATELGKLPGVAAVSEFRSGQAKLGSAGATQLQATDPSGAEQALKLDFVSGSAAALGRGEILLQQQTATDHGWVQGSSVPVTFARTGTTTLKVGGIYKTNQIAGPVLLPLPVFERNFTTQLDNVVALNARSDADLATLRAAVDRTVVALPNLKVQDQSEFKAEQRKQVNSLLGLIAVLLLLAILIAALGIINTLALSVIERTREIGLLRALGMQRRQLRRMIRLESTIIAVFGGLLGLVVGTVFGWALVAALHAQGITELVIPVGSLVGYVIAAGVIGVLAAIWPARRAARLAVLDAIATS